MSSQLGSAHASASDPAALPPKRGGAAAENVWPRAVASLALPPTLVKALSQRDVGSAWRAIAFDWSVIAASAATATHPDQTWASLVAIIVIGSRQHALFVMLHEAVHYRLSASKRWNDALADLLLGWPIGFSLPGFRASHLAHHVHTNTDEDPDWARKTSGGWHLPMRTPAFAWLILRDLLKISALRALFRSEEKSAPAAADDVAGGGRGYTWLRRAWRLGLATLAVGTLGPKAFVLYWLVPLFTWCELLLLLRNAAEHFGVEAGWFSDTRSVATSRIGRFFLAPHHVGFHLEHHLYRAVPFSRLPRLHAELARRPWFRQNACVMRSYLSVARQWVAVPSASSPHTAAALEEDALEDGGQ